MLAAMTGSNAHFPVKLPIKYFRHLLNPIEVPEHILDTMLIIVDQRDITVFVFSTIWSVTTKVLPHQTHSDTYTRTTG